MILEKEKTEMVEVDKITTPRFTDRWVWTTIREIEVFLGSGITPKGGRNVYVSHGIPFIRSQNVYARGLQFNDIAYITPEIHKKMARTKVQPGDVLLNITGASIGRSTYVPHYLTDANVNQHVCIIRPCKGIIPDFITKFFNSTFGQDQIFENQIGVTRQGLNFEQVRNLSIPLPPLSEQHRIVARIEELFTMLDAGIEALKKVKVQVKRYRQAVLKYAFEGKLTRDWREANKDEFKAILLLQEKENNGKTQDKFEDIQSMDSSEALYLPEEWIWTRVELVSDSIQYGTSEKAKPEPPGIPVIRMGNIQDGKLVFNNLKYISEDEHSIKQYILNAGNVLFNRTNSAELVGKTAVYKDLHPKAVFASYLIRVSVNRQYYDPDLLSMYINSYFGRRYINSVLTQQVGQANVNGTKLSNMPIPFLPLSEQKQIVKEIERHFSIADEVEKLVDHSLKQSERLRQSILKRAFEGKLVPQDPNDEPAEKLLERIKVERESSGTVNKQKKKSK